ncbi:MAG: hypothetical protein K9I99_09675 [Melioribacteraceae bacterium]|nr:hypothetical protein [Melioribacteraceae bacterium]
MAKAVAKNAIKDGDDIKFGIGMMNYGLKSSNGSVTGSNYNTLNTYSIFGAYNYKTSFMDKIYIEYDFQLGKKFFKQDGMEGDEINILTCDSYTHYFFAIPLTLTYHHLEDDLMHLSYSFGVFWEFAGMGEFKNEKGTRSAGYAGYDINGFDWGLNFGAEFSYYGAFIGTNYSFGYKNLAGESAAGWELKNNGQLTVSAGFRFSTLFGEDLIKLILPGGKESDEELTKGEINGREPKGEVEDVKKGKTDNGDKKDENNQKNSENEKGNGWAK